MIKYLRKIESSLGITSRRSKQIAKHVGWSIIYKIGSIIANFLIVPLTINYLDVENYGIWLTLSSFIAWFSFFDIGLGNGLRNKFAEAKAMEKYDDAQAFVSTAYFTVGSISLVAVLIFLGVNNFIDWPQVFNTSVGLDKQLTLLLPILFAFFALQLVVKLITTIYQADQHHSLPGKMQFFIQVLSLLIIWLLSKTDQSSLLIFGIIYSALPVIILLGLNFFAFNTAYTRFKPKFGLWKKEFLKEIIGLGLNFFIIQIAGLVLFSTDNFIITKIFSPEAVVPYNLAYKYFSIVSMAYTILTAPFWSSFTEAYAVGDFKWIKKSVKNVQKIWLFIPFALMVMILLADWFYYLWVGDKVSVPLHLSMAMALFVILFTFRMIYVYFINGAGKIRLQMVTSIIGMIINIPLSIFFSKYLGWGTTGVILATCFCLLYELPLWPIQFYKLITGKARGIWDK